MLAESIVDSRTGEVVYEERTGVRNRGCTLYLKHHPDPGPELPKQSKASMIQREGRKLTSKSKIRAKLATYARWSPTERENRL